VQCTRAHRCGGGGGGQTNPVWGKGAPFRNLAKLAHGPAPTLPGGCV